MEKTSNQPVFDRRAIENALEHRPPFLFVDRVMAIEPGKQIVAQKDIDSNEWYFRGHFPGRPLMPGVIITEALAQTSGLLLALEDRGDEGGIFLAEVKVKFLAPVEPGTVLEMESRLVKRFGRMFLFRVAARVAGVRVAAGSLSLAARAHT